MKQTKKPWSLLEKLMAALLVLCLAGAGTLAFLFTRETTEQQEAGADYDALEERYLYNGEGPTPTPEILPQGLAPEGEAVEDDGELLALLAAQEAENEGLATVTPRPTLAPTPSPTLAKAEQDTAQPTPTPKTTRVGEAVTEKVRYSADFGSLIALNEDVVGWLVQENTEINYPLVQGEDNEYYLTHLYTGGVNKNGSLFLDCGNAPYFTDMVTYLYGHNRKDGAMFASLPEYQSQAYYEAHPTMTLLTPYEDYRLEIFGCFRASVEEKDEWHTKSFEGKAGFNALVNSVLERSWIKSQVQPQWGDQLLALCTCTNEVQEERYIVFTRMRPIVYEGQESVSVMKMEMDAIEGTSGLVNVPGRGQTQYYAQNDPVWTAMRYESRGSGKARRFGSGGCAPTSMAMVVANLVDENNLWWLSYDSGLENGLTFCGCSVNQYFCNHRHAQYKPETPTEFRRYLPVLMASFATGNNQWNEKSRTSGSGTKPVFMKRISETYRLTFQVSKDQAEAMETLRRGGMVVAATGGSISPFTGGGHYVTLAAMDQQALYILDPYLKEDYSKTDRKGVLQVVEPGLLRVSLEHWDELCLYTYYLFESYDVD